MRRAVVTWPQRPASVILEELLRAEAEAADLRAWLDDHDRNENLKRRRLGALVGGGFSGRGEIASLKAELEVARHVPLPGRRGWAIRSVDGKHITAFDVTGYQVRYRISDGQIERSRANNPYADRIDVKAALEAVAGAE